MRARPTPIRTGSKARKVYDQAHVTWRAGAISDFYYGKRSPSDPVVVWMVDGIEHDGRDLVSVSAALDAAFESAGIVSASFGSARCGYRALHIEYADGSRLTERYDAAAGHVVREHDTSVRAVISVEVAA